MAQYTPMIQQYIDIKQTVPDTLLFFRLGDFYEMFFDDALTASKVLEITLTGREGGSDERIPMCGVPYHAAEGYIQRLVEKGYKVAICEQMEVPSAGKGIVRREIVRIVTPGTLMEGKTLDAKDNRYLATVYSNRKHVGLACVDVTTGECLIGEWEEKRGLIEELDRLRPAEIVVLQQDQDLIDWNYLQERFAFTWSVYDDHTNPTARLIELFLKQYQVQTVDSFGISNQVGAVAAGLLFSYLAKTQRRSLDHLQRPRIIRTDEWLVIDGFSRRNLELLESLRDKRKQGSLYGVLDRTVTAMGGRLLKTWVERPLLQRDAIENRLDAVEAFVKHPLFRQDVKELLDRVYDLERLLAKLSYGSANGRDLKALSRSLSTIQIMKTLESVQAEGRIGYLIDTLPDLQDVVDEIEGAIVDEPPIDVRDGGIIRDGYHQELDEYRVASRDGKQWIATLEQQERGKSGIRSLKVGYNKVFGYFLEVTRANSHLVPEYFERKQTLANSERFVTPELKHKESIILQAEEKIAELEFQIFLDIRDRVLKRVADIQQAAQNMAQLDVLQSLAEIASERGYTRPIIDQSDRIRIENGRHPVVEAALGTKSFVPNDTYLDCQGHQIALITGPNMAGKSTYMRQVALLVIMAQMGSFVPADSAEIGMVDRVFTRIGASDDLSSGQSTFMVEMVELSAILTHATSRSLIILDEIGRGTSTFDGMSIAQAVIEFLHRSPIVGAKTLFATHYHELTKLIDELDAVQNYSTMVKEDGDQIVFLRKVVPQPADRSYGIQVARLAGVPEVLLKRASAILNELESGATVEMKPQSTQQLTLWDVPVHPVVDELLQVDVMNVTPIEALQILHRLQNEARKG